MKYLLLSICIFLFVSSELISQKVGINIASPEAALDIYGDLILRSADITMADGQNTAVNINNNAFSNYRIVGPTMPFSLDGMTAAADGRLVMLFNPTDQVMTIVNASAASVVEDQILTGTGADVALPQHGSVTLQYEGSLQKWVIRSVNTTSNNNAPSWSLTGNGGTNSNNDFIGTTDGQPLVLRSANTMVAYFQHNFPSNNYIGTNYQRTGIGIIGNGAPGHTLEVGLADIAGGSQGAFGVRGTTHSSHVNYGIDEHTYIRGGKDASNVLINDAAGLGNVGIGTATPFSKLDVVGNAQVSATPMSTGVAFVTGGGALRIYNNTDSKGLTLDGAMLQAEKPKAFPLFGTNASSFTINPYGGPVGVGTNYPLGFAKLEVFTAPESRALALGDGTIGMVHFIGGANRTANSLGGYFGTNSDHPLHFYTNSQWSQMTLLQNGNLGIGTTSPSHKLSVNGTMRSQEVIVETANWPDYVFDKKYTLPDIKAVESYIDEHHHLPNVPSAANLQQSGLPLGEMQKVLMEKIEELTLYIIAQNKRIEQLEAIIKK